MRCRIREGTSQAGRAGQHSYECKQQEMCTRWATVSASVRACKQDLHLLLVLLLLPCATRT